MAYSSDSNLGFDHRNWQTVEDTFKLLAETRQNVNSISESAREAVVQNYKTPESLKIFIESHGTPVYILPNHWFSKIHAHIVLSQLGLQLGYIPKPASISGQQVYKKLILWLTRHEEKSPIYFDESRFEQGVFVVAGNQFNVPFLTHQLHHWMSCRAGLEGYSEKAQSLYQSFWNDYQGKVTSSLLKKLETDDVMELRQAIRRDMEALTFLRQMVEEVFTPANQARAQLKQSLK